MLRRHLNLEPSEPVSHNRPLDEVHGNRMVRMSPSLKSPQTDAYIRIAHCACALPYPPAPDVPSTRLTSLCIGVHKLSGSSCSTSPSNVISEDAERRRHPAGPPYVVVFASEGIPFMRRDQLTLEHSESRCTALWEIDRDCSRNSGVIHPVSTLPPVSELHAYE